MRVIGSNSPRTAIGAIGGDLRASYPPVHSASEEIARLLQLLCAMPLNVSAAAAGSDANRPQAFRSVR
jgi:hypothetical protein